VFCVAKNRQSVKGSGVAHIAKPLKHWFRRHTSAGRRLLTEQSPAWVRRWFGPLGNYADLLLVDHGVFRLIYLNQHRLGSKAWRSAQPSPLDIAGFKRRGVKTVVNLRGERKCGAYWLERAACQRHGITLENCVLRSRAAPSVSELLAVRDLLLRIEYPILIHCKSGADRAGLMSVLYMHLVEGQSIEEAVLQLSWKFGHFKQADTGVLDHFFAAYLVENAGGPIDFYEWVETRYDPRNVLATFRANGLASRIVNDILRRE